MLDRFLGEEGLKASAQKRLSMLVVNVGVLLGLVKMSEVYIKRTPSLRSLR